MTTPVLHVGLSSWIIQDGNYGDFAVGQRSKFAMEFRPLNMRPAAAGSKTAEHLGASHYRVHAEVVFIGPEVWVIDAGTFVAYQHVTSARLVKSRTWVEGDLYLGIDPFFYFEELHSLPGMPPLRCEFLIRGIMLETTPWIDARDERGRVFKARDKGQEAFVPVTETNAWHDDGGLGHYVLECEPPSPLPSDTMSWTPGTTEP